MSIVVPIHIISLITFGKAERSWNVVSCCCCCSSSSSSCDGVPSLRPGVFLFSPWFFPESPVPLPGQRPRLLDRSDRPGRGGALRLAVHRGRGRLHRLGPQGAQHGRQRGLRAHGGRPSVLLMCTSLTSCVPFFVSN